jgi:cell volume regulation protein A
VARPVSVFISLAFAKRMKKRERLFVAWAGLRGAVPIITATFPLLAGVPKAGLIFNLVFFVVLTSVLIQGMGLVTVAKLLRVGSDQPPKKPDSAVTTPNIVRLVMPQESLMVGKSIVEISLPATALIILLHRGRHSYIPKGATVLEAGDEIVIATRKDDEDELRLLFERG